MSTVYGCAWNTKAKVFFIVLKNSGPLTWPLGRTLHLWTPLLEAQCVHVSLAFKGFWPQVAWVMTITPLQHTGTIQPATGMTLIFHVHREDQQKLQVRANEVSGYSTMKYSQSTHTNYEIAQSIKSKCHISKTQLSKIFLIMHACPKCRTSRLKANKGIPLIKQYVGFPKWKQYGLYEKHA